EEGKRHDQQEHADRQRGTERLPRVLAVLAGDLESGTGGEEQTGGQRPRLQEGDEPGAQRLPWEAGRAKQVPPPAERVGDDGERVATVREHEAEAERDPRG